MNALSRTLVLTADGSHTVSLPEANITFHSKHGAIQESKHVFIDAGFSYAKTVFPGEALSILEIGFGTGLNAFLTAIEALSMEQPIRYTAIDIHPLDMVTTTALNYPDKLGHEDLFNAIQLSPWNSSSPIHERFTLEKDIADLMEFTCREQFHLVYFDAFSPEAQPELWTEEIFERLAGCMFPGASLVTYCSKSIVRRALKDAGWKVAKLPGPRGKREMVRATI